jgi:hypothetical protein
VPKLFVIEIVQLAVPPLAIVYDGRLTESASELEPATAVAATTANPVNETFVS